MLKILKPYTIIPSNLYVKRDADRQLREIIDDMGRPGYVLVSRQMGKTNLLLNAKRELESSNDVFVYVDLSNNFDDAKSCFQNIVDTAIETNIDKFDSIASLIYDKRTSQVNIPPHKQHITELRLLLNSIKGKLVIILDEIDALTKTNYSDQIFSQIRSIYFSRVNYPELNNLTYILSGVVEPTEIIKDQKISPFNIGQKIFLNDFSKNEFKDFLSKSYLNLSEEVQDRIYYWTNGNPRITWDVCAAIESSSDSLSITAEVIDKLVTKMYLTSYDKPPIDNIRELVKKDREIKNALVEIHYKKGDQITDKVKSKLYLSGIINYDEKEIDIKNNIIKQSLSLDWINSLVKDGKDKITDGLEHINKERYEIGLKFLEEYLLESEFDDSDWNICYHEMGRASYHLKNYVDGIKYLLLSKIDKEDEPKYYYRKINILGLCYYFTGEIDNALEAFMEIIKASRKDEVYLGALLNYANILMFSDTEIHLESAKKIFEGVINDVEVNPEKLNKSFINKIKSLSYYCLGKIQYNRGDVKEGVDSFISAISLSDKDIKPTIIITLASILPEKEQRRHRLLEIIGDFEKGLIIPKNFTPENPLDFTFSHYRLLLQYCYQLDRNLFDRAFKYIHFLGNKSNEEHYYDLGLDFIRLKQLSYAREILTETKSRIELKGSSLYYETIKALAYVSRYIDNRQLFIEYAEMFFNQEGKPIDSMDLEIFAKTIHGLIQDKNYNNALEYFNNLDALRDKIDSNLVTNFMLIDYLALNLYITTSNKVRIHQKAKSILEIASKIDKDQETTGILGETGLKIIKSNAEHALNESIAEIINNEVTLPEKKDFVRVLYLDGTIVTAKYKKVAEDINKGKCVVINS